MNTPNNTYQNLDRAALWLVFGEFALAALLLMLAISMVAGNLMSGGALYLDYGTGEIIGLSIALIYGFAYLANLSIGILGLFFYVRDNREGYPGTGHLVNWFLSAATVWVVLFLVIMVIMNGF